MPIGRCFISNEELTGEMTLELIIHTSHLPTGVDVIFVSVVEYYLGSLLIEDPSLRSQKNRLPDDIIGKR